MQLVTLYFPFYSCISRTRTLHVNVTTVKCQFLALFFVVIYINVSFSIHVICNKHTQYEQNKVLRHAFYYEEIFLYVNNFCKERICFEHETLIDYSIHTETGDCTDNATLTRWFGAELRVACVIKWRREGRMRKLYGDTRSVGYQTQHLAWSE